MSQVDLGIGGDHILLERAIDRPGLVALGWRNEVALDQVVLAVEVALGLFEIDRGPRQIGTARCERCLLHANLRLGGIDIGLGLTDPVLEGLRVDPGDDLTLFHLGIEVGEHLADLTRYLGAHLHLYGGCQRARGRHRGGERAALDLGGAQLGLIARRTFIEPPPCATGKRGGSQQQTDQGS